MGGPGVRRNFVFTPAGVAAGFGVHFEKDKIGETALAKAPGGAEAGDSAADNDDGNFFDMLRGGEARVVAQKMTGLEGIVDERAFDVSFALEGKADKRGAAEPEKLAAAKLQ